MHDLVLTFDTNKPNYELLEEVQSLLKEINELLAQNITTSLPQLYVKDNKYRISVVPIKSEDYES